MFDKLINFFKAAEKQNDERFQEFMKTSTEIATKFPPKICKELAKKQLHPSTNQPGWSIDYSLKDLVWWKEQYAANYVVMKDMKAFNKEIHQALLDILDKTDYGTPNEEMATILKEILDENP